MRKIESKVTQEIRVEKNAELAPRPVIQLDRWDPEEIIKGFIQSKHDRNVFASYYESVRQRFIVGQDTKTAKKRYQFLKAQFEQLKLTKDFAEEFSEIKLHSLKQEGKELAARLENKKLENQLQNEDQQQSINQLRRKKKLLQEQLEIKELEQKINSIKNLPQNSQPTEQTKIAESKLEQIDRETENLTSQAKEVSK